jgi:hypothetical protein
LECSEARLGAVRHIASYQPQTRSPGQSPQNHCTLRLPNPCASSIICKMHEVGGIRLDLRYVRDGRDDALVPVA